MSDHKESTVTLEKHPLFHAAKELEVRTGFTVLQLLEEFRRFMAMKVVMRDTECELISPTGLIDHLWHAAILDTRYYACGVEAGDTIHLMLGVTGC